MFAFCNEIPNVIKFLSVYIVRKRTTGFIRHCTGNRRLVSQCAGIRYITSNTSRADVIKSTTSRYNKIMEIVRIKKIPVKYFAYASAEKCAVQLAEYDTEEI